MTTLAAFFQLASLQFVDFKPPHLLHLWRRSGNPLGVDCMMQIVFCRLYRAECIVPSILSWKYLFQNVSCGLYRSEYFIAKCIVRIIPCRLLCELLLANFTVGIVSRAACFVRSVSCGLYHAKCIEGLRCWVVTCDCIAHIPKTVTMYRLDLP